MAEPNEVVAALARAYSLSEVFAPEESPVREALEDVADAMGDTLVLRIEGGAVRIDGSAVQDEDGSVSELARDLELADVCQVRLPTEVTRDDLEGFVSALREGAGRGDGTRSADALGRDHPGVGVAFGGAGAGRAGPGRVVAALFGTGPGAGGSGGGTATTPEAGPAAAEEAGPAAAEETSEPGEGAGAADLAAPDVGEASGERGGARLPGADLAPAVSRYLEAGPREREEAARDLRAAAEGARREGALDELAEAVERLALLPETSEGGEEGSGPPALARELLDPRVADRIVVRLGASREGEWRQERIRALPRLGSDIAPALADALAETDDRTARRAYTDALVALGDEARSEIEEMLEDDRWFVVRNGVRILARIGSERDVRLLTSPLAHDEPKVRRETVVALGRIGGEDAGMLVLGMLDDPEPEVRAAVAMALGAMGSERAVKPLLQRLEDERDEEARIQIVRALGAIGDPGAVPALEKRAVGTFFSRPSRPLRIAAYRALAGIGTPHAMELLDEARDDGDEEVRRTVRSLLEEEE